MPDVIFALDVEDPVNEASDDAVLELCNLFCREDVPLSLFLAGEKARVLRQRGRRDVIEALSRHEICYHGNYWGDFPIPALEYGQDMTWDDAVAHALRVELPGLHDVAEITGQFPVAWCCHQAQQCPQLAYALKLAGVRCWAGGPRGWMMNWLSWPRSKCVVSLQGSWDNRVDPTRRDELKEPADVERDMWSMRVAYEALAERVDFICFAGHPTCFVTADWGGLYEYAVLFRDGGPVAYPRPSGIAHSQPRSAEDRAAALRFVRETVRWVKAQPDANITGYAALCALDEEPLVQWLSLPQMLEIAREAQAVLNYVTAFGMSFSPADIVGLLAFACQYCWHNGAWPERLPVQRLLGPTQAPLAQTGPVTMTREHLFAGALSCYATMMDHGRIPGVLRAGRVDVGPGTWLRALAQFVIQSRDTGELPLEVTVEEADTLPACVEEPAIGDRRFGSTNHRPGLSYEPLRELLRWQSWSYRPAMRR